MSLGSDTKRRLSIMLHWHERAPLKGDNLSQLWKTFVTALLYQKLDFCIDTAGLYLFGAHIQVSKAFFIPFSWLTHDERVTVHHMTAQRQHFFSNKEKIYHGDRMLLTGFVANKKREIFTLKARKLLLRDFCGLVYQTTPLLRLPLSLIMLDLGIKHADTFCILMSKALIGYTPEGPSLTPIE